MVSSAPTVCETNTLVKASKVESVWFHIGWKLDRLQSTGSEKEWFVKGQGLGSDLVATAEGTAQR